VCTGPGMTKHQPGTGPHRRQLPVHPHAPPRARRTRSVPGGSLLGPRVGQRPGSLGLRRRRRHFCFRSLPTQSRRRTPLSIWYTPVRNLYPRCHSTSSTPIAVTTSRLRWARRFGCWLLMR
jgi:hypothetical protein